MMGGRAARLILPFSPPAWQAVTQATIPPRTNTDDLPPVLPVADDYRGQRKSLIYKAAPGAPGCPR